MTDKQSLEEDLAYVRAAAEQSTTVHVPAIYLLWAALSLCGFALIDVMGPESAWIGFYWLIATPAGLGTTWWLAGRAGCRAGLYDRDTDNRWKLHFLGFLAAGLLGYGAIAAGQLTWSGFGSLWILLLALTYFLAGLHLNSRLLPIGLLLGVGYLVSLFMPEYGFTTVGVAFAGALTTQAFLGARAEHASD